MKSIYLSGYSMALHNAWPEHWAFLTQTEVARIASMVASATSLPVIADARRRLRQRALDDPNGAGVHEDRRAPASIWRTSGSRKRCGHIAARPSSASRRPWASTGPRSTPATASIRTS